MVVLKKNIPGESSLKNDNALENGDLPIMDTDIPNPAENEVFEVQGDVTKSSALCLLKLEEECYLPKSTKKSVLENTKTIVQEALSVIKTHVEQCLTDNDVDPKNVPGLSASIRSVLCDMVEVERLTTLRFTA